MKTLLKLFHLLILSLAIHSTANAQSSVIAIHHIGAGDGDATLIMVVDSTGTNLYTHLPIWDTCVVLIDGQREGAGGEVWRYVRDTVSHYFPHRKKLDFIIVSHLHIDHYGGLTKLITNAVGAGWNIDAVVTRMAVTSALADPNNVIDTCYSDINVINANSTKLTQFFNVVKQNKIAQPAVIAGNQLFASKGFKNITMQCLVSLGAALNNSGGTTVFLPETYPGSGKYKAKSENDLSYGFLITFQGFHYLTLGDLGGVNGSNYVDGESYVTKYLDEHYGLAVDYHLCGLKVSHHGSAESTTADFIRINNPYLGIFPASLKTYGKSKNPLPTQTAVTNVCSNPNGTNMLATYLPKNPDTLSSWWTYQNLEYLVDVVLIINAPGYPDSDHSLNITVIRAAKNPANYQYIPGGTNIKNFGCTKGHDW